MASRSYHDRCGIARALDVLGDRWALLIVRELLLGPKRFTDLRSGLPRVGPDVLAQRLKELEGSGVLHKRRLEPPAAARVYELTERGAALENLVLELGRWGSGEGFNDDQGPLGPDSFVLALKTLLDPSPAIGFEAKLGLRIGGVSYEALLGAHGLSFRRGEATHPKATIDGSPDDLARLLWHDGGPGAALDSQQVKVEGDRVLAERFLGLFAQPRPAVSSLSR